MKNNYSSVTADSLFCCRQNTALIKYIAKMNPTSLRNTTLADWGFYYLCTRHDFMFLYIKESATDVVTNTS